jgi:DNA-binding LytR/AlgR family response regulator
VVPPALGLKLFCAMKINWKKDTCFIESRTTAHELCYADILYIECMKPYICIYFISHSRIVVQCRLKEILNHLPHDVFLLCNRHKIVNLHHVIQCSYVRKKLFVQLSTGHSFEASVRRSAYIMQTIKNYQSQSFKGI